MYASPHDLSHLDALQKVTDVEQDTEDSRGDVNDSEKGHHDVVQWKEVLQQLSLVEKQQGDESQQIAGLNHALRELQVNLVRAIQRETNQVHVCTCFM